MGLEDLLAALARNARLEARAVLKRAHDERRQILEATRERVAALQHHRLVERKEALSAETQEKVAEARREARAAVLAAQERLIERVLAVVDSRLTDPGTLERLRSTMPVRLPQLLQYAPDSSLVIRCSPGLESVVRDVLGHASSVEVREDPELSSGVRVESGGGRLVIDDTLAARLRRRRLVLRMAIAGGDAEEPG